ncbi:MAG: hypothetical protein PHF79_03120 [Candidatus Pacebacteria bacterium]|nr:hypothetical protein [Candidatus Paceibacterota bacterium]
MSRRIEFLLSRQACKGSLMLELVIACIVGSLTLGFGFEIMSGNMQLEKNILADQTWLDSFAALFGAASTTPFADHVWSQTVGERGSPNLDDIFFLTSDWQNGFGKSTCRLGPDFSALDVFDPVKIATNWSDRFDWQSTTVHPISFSIEADSIPTAMDVRGRYIYMTADSARATSSDFHILDRHDPAHIIASLDTGPGLLSIATAGTLAYVGNSSVTNQLQIIDISDPTHPFIRSTLKMSGLQSGASADVLSLAFDFYNGSARVYLGMVKNVGAELRVIDVSDPDHPQEIGGYEFGSGINSIAVDHGLVYVATPASQELTVLSFASSPASSTPPLVGTEVGYFDAPKGSGNGKHLDLSMEKVFLGRTKGGGDELYVLNAASTSIQITSLASTTSFRTGASIEGIIGRWPVAGIFSASTTASFEIVQFGATTTFPLGQVLFSANLLKPVALDCDDTSFFALVATSTNPLYQIDIPLKK